MECPKNGLDQIQGVAQVLTKHVGEGFTDAMVSHMANTDYDKAHQTICDAMMVMYEADDREGFQELMRTGAGIIPRDEAFEMAQSFGGSVMTNTVQAYAKHTMDAFALRLQELDDVREVDQRARLSAITGEAQDFIADYRQVSGADVDDEYSMDYRPTVQAMDAMRKITELDTANVAEFQAQALDIVNDYLGRPSVEDSKAKTLESIRRLAQMDTQKSRKAMLNLYESGAVDAGTLLGETGTLLKFRNKLLRAYTRDTIDDISAVAQKQPLTREALDEIDDKISDYLTTLASNPNTTSHLMPPPLGAEKLETVQLMTHIIKARANRADEDEVLTRDGEVLLSVIEANHLYQRIRGGKIESESTRCQPPCDWDVAKGMVEKHIFRTLEEPTPDAPWHVKSDAVTGAIDTLNSIKREGNTKDAIALVESGVIPSRDVVFETSYSPEVQGRAIEHYKKHIATGMKEAFDNLWNPEAGDVGRALSDFNRALEETHEFGKSLSDYAREPSPTYDSIVLAANFLKEDAMAGSLSQRSAEYDSVRTLFSLAE